MTKSTGVGRHPPSQKTHGHSFLNGKPTPTYASWSGMKYRCLNKNCANYRDYGGRGITVCKEWVESFESFLKDMGERPPNSSIDRIDNSKGYTPENCRWASRKEQGRNKRSVRVVVYNGEKIALPDLAERLGKNQHIVRQRLRRGWPVERAFQ